MDKNQLNQLLRENIQAEMDSVLLGKTHDARYIVAACSASVIDTDCFIESNGPAIETDYDHRLVCRIKNCFGGKTVGEKSGLEPWPIGRRAEQHAANEVLKHTHEPSVNIDDFQFSDALKTSNPDLPVPYCNNCKTIFPQLN